MPRDSRAGSAVQGLVLGAPIALFAALGWTHRWTYEDGFIYLRVVKQITAGHGPVFNTGQRVEAFTGPLWLALLTIGDVLTPFRLEWIATGLGLVLAIAGAVLCVAGAARLARQLSGDAFLLPIGFLVPAALVPVWQFETSGLETGLLFAWIGLCLWLLAAWTRSTPRPLSKWSAVVLGLGWLIRPELVVVSAVFAGAVLLGERDLRAGWRARVQLLLAMFALPLLYELFRIAYYGSLIANTAIAKEATRARWVIGWRYLLDLVQPYWLWLPIVALGAGAYVPLVIGLRRLGRTRSVWVIGAFVTAGLLSATYVVMVGGDYVHGRLLLPAVFLLCAPVATIPAQKVFLVASGVVVAWAIVCALTLRPSEWEWAKLPPATRAAHPLVTVDHPFISPQQSGEVDDHARGMRWYHGPAVYFQTQRVAATSGRGVALPVSATYAIGAAPYEWGPKFNVVDLLGLADPLTAHFALSRRGVTGHEKPLPPAWFVARFIPASTPVTATDFQRLRFPQLIPETTGTAFTDQVAWARRALACGPIRDLVEAPDKPLTFGRIISNIEHAFTRTRLRIPPDPEAAYRRFCGTTTTARVAAASPRRTSARDAILGTAWGPRIAAVAATGARPSDHSSAFAPHGDRPGVVRARGPPKRPLSIVCR